MKGLLSLCPAGQEYSVPLESLVEMSCNPYKSWSEEVFVDPTLNILDLSNNKWNLKEFRTIHMPKGESMPQSVAANGLVFFLNPFIHLFQCLVFCLF